MITPAAIFILLYSSRLGLIRIELDAISIFHVCQSQVK
jgi:hypothetical protein